MMKKVDPKAKNVAMLYEDDEFSRSVRDGALQYMVAIHEKWRLQSGGLRSNLPVTRSSNEFGFAILD
jgi:hypothetical protein